MEMEGRERVNLRQDHEEPTHNLNNHEEDDTFHAKRRQAGALLKDLDVSLGQLEGMVEKKRMH